MLCDQNAALARRFGAETSGHVILYGPDGKLKFSGGITRSRGDIGDNTGRRALHDLLAERSSAFASNPIFGCPLFGPKTGNGPPTNFRSSN